MITRLGITRKLLYAFLLMAGLSSLASLIAWSGFKQVLVKERQVSEVAIPAMATAQKLAELNSTITNIAQLLNKAEDQANSYSLGTILTGLRAELSLLVNTMESPPFPAEQLREVRQLVTQIDANLFRLEPLTSQRITFQQQLHTHLAEYDYTLSQIADLAQSQVANANTIAIVNLVNIYNLVGSNIETSAVFESLDKLLEDDIDQLEQMSELLQKSYQLRYEIRKLSAMKEPDDINELQAKYDTILKVISRRVSVVADPQRGSLMEKLVSGLKQSGLLFQSHRSWIGTLQNLDTLNHENQQLFLQLNDIVNAVVESGTQTINASTEELNELLHQGEWVVLASGIATLVLLVFLMWKVVYKDIVSRLEDRSKALRSLAQGDLNLHIERSGNDELAEMGEAIEVFRQNILTRRTLEQELIQHKMGLEREVELRTEELTTSNRQLNEEAHAHAEAKLRAEQANRAKTTFLAHMSHEIRTPMNGVIGTLELLRRTPMNASQKSLVETSLVSSVNLLDILNDILDYSKIESTKVAIVKESFKPVEMLRMLMNLMEPHARQKGLQLNLQICSELPEWIEGDQGKLRQILGNLIGNAIKFTESGSVSLDVECQPIQESPQILFKVVDTGIGIAEHQQKEIFSAFSQFSNFNHQEGTGLGLTISRRLVTALGGDLQLESTLGEGSQFWFYIPLIPGEPPRIAKYDASSTSLGSKKFLLVEDNPVNQKVAEGFLSSQGHSVITASNGKEALSLTESYHFDAFLIDINLPDIDGTALCQKLKTLAEEKHLCIPALAMSAHVFKEEVDSYLQRGFDGFVVKPIQYQTLQSTLVGLFSENKTDLKQSPFISNQGKQNTQLHSPTIDISILEQDLDYLGKDRVIDMIQLFINETPHIINEVVHSKDCEMQSAGLHRIKGSAASLGLPRLSELCSALENYTKECVLNIDQVFELKRVVQCSIDALNENYVN